MSLDATWDLASPSQPRSFCVYTAPSNDNTASSHSHPHHPPTSSAKNPFEVAAAHPSEQATAQAVVVGTEHGSLHYRTFAPPNATSNAANANNKHKPTSALGMQMHHNPNLPRHLYPVDLAASGSGGGLAGPVMSIVPIATHLFLVLVDDHRGTSAAHPGAFGAQWVTLHQGRFAILSNSNTLPRMSCAVYHPLCGVVYAAGRKLGHVMVPDTAATASTTTTTKRLSARKQHQQHQQQTPKIRFDHMILPAPGARSGPDAMAINSAGTSVVVAVGNTFYACLGVKNTSSSNAVMELSDDAASVTSNSGASSQIHATKILSFSQSSQVHPVLCVDVMDPSMDQDWSCWLLASSRTCAVIDVYQGPPPRMTTSNPRGDTVTLASPILSAATSWPWLVVLTSDGLLSVRSPSCLAIALRTVEVGTRPNDYFSLRTLPPSPWIVATSYAGQSKVLHCQPDSIQDLADRFMRLAIDALGANGFPRAALAEAVHASFTATSYVGPEPSPHSRYLLKHYLEAVLGLMDLESGATTSWPTTTSSTPQASSATGGTLKDAAVHQGAFGEAHHSSHNSSTTTTAQGRKNQERLPPVVSAATPASLLTGTALLCLVCAYLQPPQASLANRAAKKCVSQLGMIVTPQELSCDGAVQVCESVADTLLDRPPVDDFSLNVGSSPKPIMASTSSSRNLQMEFVEAAVWLLRSCGKHERAMQALYERLQQQQQQSSSAAASGTSSGGGAGPESSTKSASTSGSSSGGWSQIKYDSYTATHLSELWGTGRPEACQLVLESDATHRLLEHNPRLGLSAFTALHPQNESQWRQLKGQDDPLAHPTYPRQVLQLLQSVQPVIPYDSTTARGRGGRPLNNRDDDGALATNKTPADDDGAGGDKYSMDTLPLESGRALAVTFLESALGIATGRPTEKDEFDSLPMDQGFVDRLADFNDELAFLLLEGVIAERGDNEPSPGDGKTSSIQDDSDDTPLGRVYRRKLRRLLRWPLCKVRADRFLSALPASFLQERAFVLGNLGRHEEALKIFYCDLKRLELALEYCDARHEQLQAKRERDKAHRQKQGGGFFDDLVMNEQEHGYFDSYDNGSSSDSDCAYIPLVRVALESSESPEEGTTAAIQVLALRRSVMDRGAALRLLPKDVPVSAVARPFLIPALVESESQVRRLTVVSSLLRARYVSLKQQLTAAQLKAQENLHVVPQLRNLNLGDPLHSTKPFRARPSSSASSTFPDVMIIKHFFPRHLVIQVKVKHTLEGRSLGDVTFVVAESSEEAIQPSLQVPLKVLPYNVQGSTWCVLSASPQRMDSLAILTCELRYTLLDAEGAAGFAAASASATPGGARYVEELQDLEVYATHFT